MYHVKPQAAILSMAGWWAVWSCDSRQTLHWDGCFDLGDFFQGGTASWSCQLSSNICCRLDEWWTFTYLYVTSDGQLTQAADAIEQMLLALNYIHSHGLWAQRVALGIMFFFSIGCVSPCSVRFGSEENKNKLCWSLQLIESLPSNCRLKFITLQLADLAAHYISFCFSNRIQIGKQRIDEKPVRWRVLTSWDILRHCAPRSEAGKFPAPFWKLPPSEKHSIAGWSSVMVAKWFYNSIIHSINGVYWLLILGLHTALTLTLTEA